MLGRNPGAGLMIMSDTTMVVHRELICSLANRYRLPTVYPYRFYIIGGGLLSSWDRFGRCVSGCGLVRRPHTAGQEAE
jgi:hypothetical protein